jgi:hypothetical protein
MGQCQSCGMPMEAPEDHGAGDINNPYCKYCTDEQGNLLPRETVKENIINFHIKTSGKTREEAEIETDNLMAGMPAWKVEPVEPQVAPPPTPAPVEPQETIPQPTPVPASPSAPVAAAQTASAFPQPEKPLPPPSSGGFQPSRPNLPFASRPTSAVSSQFGPSQPQTPSGQPPWKKGPGGTE